MEYCGGFEIGVLGQGKNPEFEPFKKEISKKITQLYSDMIFLHGYVHCDPHPGSLVTVFYYSIALSIFVFC